MSLRILETWTYDAGHLLYLFLFFQFPYVFQISSKLWSGIGNNEGMYSESIKKIQDVALLNSKHFK